MTLLQPSVGPTAGRATTTPARVGTHLTLLKPRHARHSSRQKEDHQLPQVPQSQHQVRLPQLQKSKGTTEPRPSSRCAATPATPQTAPREEDLDRLKKNLARSCTTDRSADKNSSSCSRSTCNRHFRNSRRLRDNCLSTLLLISSRQPSFLASGQERQVATRVTASGHESV